MFCSKWTDETRLIGMLQRKSERVRKGMEEGGTRRVGNNDGGEGVRRLGNDDGGEGVRRVGNDDGGEGVRRLGNDDGGEGVRRVGNDDGGEGVRRVGNDDGGEGVGDGFDVLNFIGFQWDMVSPAEMSGRFRVLPKSSQPFGVLHGGITAFLAETLPSLGAQIVSQWARVAGIDLTVNHLQSAPIGSEVIAKAVPLRVGKRVQVWDVTFTTPNTKSLLPNEFTTVAVARLSVIVGLPDPERGRKGNEKLIAIAREKGVELVPLLKSKL